MKAKKIVITGGPGTGKSSIINELKRRGHVCFEEISRQVTLEAKQNGIEQLFLTEPLLFSQRLIEGRQAQFLKAEETAANIVFLDRGVHDVLAYMDYIKDSYPTSFVEACKVCVYDYVFILKPWQSIYTIDNERYESFEQAVEIHDHLLQTYQKFHYDLLDVPFDSVKNRASHILNTIEKI